MMRNTALMTIIVFLAMSLALPFALSTCDSGVFCFASTSAGHAPANTCNTHDTAHVALFAQFGECMPQTPVAVALVLFVIVIMAVLWTVIHEFARSFLGLHTAHLDALNAPGDLSHMKPWEPLRLAFARGIMQRKDSAHNIV